MDDVASTCFPLWALPVRLLNSKMYTATKPAKTVTTQLAMMMDVEDIMCFSFNVVPEKSVREEAVPHHARKRVLVPA